MLYILRHGKTDWNQEKRLQGQTDIPLNDEGRQMAVDAGKNAIDIHFDICFSSPLIRARETAELFLKGRDVEIVFDDRLKEMSFGVYEGVKNVVEDPESSMRSFFLEPEKYVAVDGAESFDDLFQRTGALLEEMVEPRLKEGQNVLIVGHGAINASIMCRIKGMPLSKFWDNPVKNCELVKIK